MTFKLIDRVPLIVQLYSIRNTRQLQNFGQVHYVSRRMKYALVYVNSATVDQAMEQINHLDFVKTVTLSPKKEISLNFEEVLGPDDTTFIRSLTGSYHERSLDEIVASFKTNSR